MFPSRSPQGLMQSMAIILLIFTLEIERVRSRVFTFAPSMRISQLSNWLNQDYPCQGDTIVFEENKKTVTFIDESMQVSSVILPHVGSLIFSDNSVLGEKSPWQCTRRKSPEKVFFQPEAIFPAFSDPASWTVDDKPLLHMNMVPGPKDDVIFHDVGAFQISIDDQVTVNTLKVSKDWVGPNTG
uniref:Protein amnionless n=2 Tax=Haemonchus contortus TaxID=6289 RepID=A0A7I5ED38_HAECO